MLLYPTTSVPTAQATAKAHEFGDIAASDAARCSVALAV